MRNIKFKAWDTVQMQMFDPFDLFEVTDCRNESAWFDKNEIIFLQFTGLKDKNGNELYEGDIVVINGHDGDSQEHSDWLNSLNAAKSLFDKIPIIELKRDVVTMSRFPTFWLENEKFGYEGEELQESEEWEKIGNIHENPELLETS